MTEIDFLKLNAEIRRAREQTEPVHISQILPQVMRAIEQRIKQQRGSAI